MTDAGITRDDVLFELRIDRETFGELRALAEKRNRVGGVGGLLRCIAKNEIDRDRNGGNRRTK